MATNSSSGTGTAEQVLLDVAAAIDLDRSPSNPHPTAAILAAQAVTEHQLIATRILDQRIIVDSIDLVLAAGTVIHALLERIADLEHGDVTIALVTTREALTRRSEGSPEV